MRFILLTLLLVACALSATADEIKISDVVKASLVFREDADANRPYPHVLKVFLRLDNAHSSEVTWVATGKLGIQAELLDPQGNPVPQGPQASSIVYNPTAFSLPYGSRLDLLLSHGGISLLGDAKDKYALTIGKRGWLIPIETAGTYSLRIRMWGWPWTKSVERGKFGEPKLLLDLAPTKIEVSK